MKILGISGSPRRHGNTAEVTGAILAGAEACGAETETVHLGEYAVSGCIGCERCRRDKTCTQFYDGMHLLYPKVEAADVLVLGSPAYNYNVTPQVKAFIDRLYPYFDFSEPRPGPYRSRLADQGKQAAVFGICEQQDPREVGYTVVSMADALQALGYEITVQQVFPRLFLPAAAKQHPGVIEQAREIGRSICSKR